MATTHRARILAMIPAFALVGAAAASAPTDEGSYDAVSCYVGQVSLLNTVEGHLAGSYDNIGTPMRSEGQLGYGSSLRCTGAFVVSAGQNDNRGACVVADPDGDRFFLVYSGGGGAPGKWHATGGTGKYRTIQAEGTYEQVARPKVPAVQGRIQFCNREIGRWKLR